MADRLSTTLLHSGTLVGSFADLLSQYGDTEFESPLRSTVALLSYWREADTRLPEFASALGLSRRETAELHFEFHVPVQQGTGKPSCTDLLLRSGAESLAIEAKSTEPRYQEVDAWLGGQTNGNRWDVLNGWLNLLNVVTGALLTPDLIQELPYQLIHRAASACHPKEASKWLVYHVFSATSADADVYRRELASLRYLLGPREPLHIRLAWSESKPRERQSALLDRWSDGERHLSAEVKAGLIAGDLLDFGRLEVTAV